MNATRIKAAVRQRDGFCCTRCGMTNDEHRTRYGRQLDVHRTTPGSLYSTAPGVCVTLCRACHGPESRRGPGEIDRANPGRVPLSASAATQLNTVAALMRQMGRRFDKSAFLNGLVCGPVDELHEATTREFAEFWADQQVGAGI